MSEEKLKEVLIHIELGFDLSSYDTETILYLDKEEILSFNKMDCPFWEEVPELVNSFKKNKNYYKLVNSIL